MEKAREVGNFQISDILEANACGAEVDMKMKYDGRISTRPTEILVLGVVPTRFNNTGNWSILKFVDYMKNATVPSKEYSFYFRRLQRVNYTIFLWYLFIATMNFSPN